MKRVPSKPPPAAKVRDWRVAIIRKKLERLGRVAAVDREAAEAAAIEEFKLTDEQRKRLVLQEWASDSFIEFLKQNRALYLPDSPRKVGSSDRSG